MSEIPSGNITRECYCKIILHSFKWSTQTVCGFLIGTIQEGLNEQDSPTYVYEDAIPIFHHPPTAPMCEVAGEIVQKFCEENEKEILGLYFGSTEYEVYQYLLFYNYRYLIIYLEQ